MRTIELSVLEVLDQLTAQDNTTSYAKAEKTDCTLELTCLKERKEAYDLGEGEFHLCLRVEGDYDRVREYHRQMGCICYENTQMGLYLSAIPMATGLKSCRKNRGSLK